MIQKAKQDYIFNCLRFMKVYPIFFFFLQGQHARCYNFYSKKKKNQFWAEVRLKTRMFCTVPFQVLCSGRIFLFPLSNSHANNFLLSLFAHQTHAARLLFSLSSPQYFMPLKVHLFSPFPVSHRRLTVKTWFSIIRHPTTTTTTTFLTLCASWSK